MKRYFFEINVDGKPTRGTALDVPNEYTVEGDESIWLSQERSFFESGQWITYDQLTIAITPTNATVNEEIIATVTLPVGSVDTSVTFTVTHTDVDGNTQSTEIVSSVTNEQATHSFSFTEVGAYTISASSVHHGVSSGEVIISESTTV